MTVSVQRPAEGDPFASMAAFDALSGRLRNAIGAYYAARTAWTAAKGLAERMQTARQYTVTVDGDDNVYADLHAWLVERTPPAERRSLRASTSRGDQPVDVDSTRRPARVVRVVRVAYDGRKPQTVIVADRRVRVEVALPEWITQAANVDASRFRDLMRISFTCPDETSRDAVLDLIAELANRTEHRKPRFNVAGQWGGWRDREHPGRSLETVVLRQGQAERIDADLARFLAAENDYRRLGQPWHRGYLFHGPPGTGKTSLARALSTEHCLDLYYLPLSAVRNDAALFELLSMVSDRAMLLIEDVDVAHAGRVRDDGEPGVTLSGLLNALDGVATPNGMVSVLTTNDPSVLDAALLRRADVSEHLDVLDGAQLSEMAYRLAGIYLPPTIATGNAAPYLAVEAIARHRDDPATLTTALESLVSGTAI